jgi:hypothetical protein
VFATFFRHSLSLSLSLSHSHCRLIKFLPLVSISMDALTIGCVLGLVFGALALALALVNMFATIPDSINDDLPVSNCLVLVRSAVPLAVADFEAALDSDKLAAHAANDLFALDSATTLAMVKSYIPSGKDAADELQQPSFIGDGSAQVQVAVESPFNWSSSAAASGAVLSQRFFQCKIDAAAMRLDRIREILEGVVKVPACDSDETSYDLSFSLFRQPVGAAVAQS